LWFNYEANNFSVLVKPNWHSLSCSNRCTSGCVTTCARSCGPASSSGAGRSRFGTTGRGSASRGWGRRRPAPRRRADRTPPRPLPRRRPSQTPAARYDRCARNRAPRSQTPQQPSHSPRYTRGSGCWCPLATKKADPKKHSNEHDGQPYKYAQRPQPLHKDCTH